MQQLLLCSSLEDLTSQITRHTYSGIKHTVIRFVICETAAVLASLSHLHRGRLGDSTARWSRTPLPPCQGDSISGQNLVQANQECPPSPLLLPSSCIISPRRRRPPKTPTVTLPPSSPPLPNLCAAKIQEQNVTYLNGTVRRAQSNRGLGRDKRVLLRRVLPRRLHSLRRFRGLLVSTRPELEEPVLLPDS